MIIKKIFIILCIINSTFVFSQIVDYTAIRKVVSNKFPDIDFSDKILALSIWNSSDMMSRNLNKEFYRTYFVYQGARLSGGLKGVIFISISNDSSEMTFKIAEKKDGLNNLYTICDYEGYELTGKLSKMKLDKSIKNIVFNSQGNLIFQNLEIDAVFKSFNNLITR